MYHKTHPMTCATYRLTSFFLIYANIFQVKCSLRAKTPKSLIQFFKWAYNKIYPVTQNHGIYTMYI